MYGTEKPQPKAGIVENCRLEKVVFTNNNLDFWFKQPNGASVNNREFEASAQYGDLDKQRERISQRVGHITRSALESLVTPEQYQAKVGASESWSDYCSKIVSLFEENPSYKEIPLRVKFIYSKKGFIKLPLIVKSGLVEDMNLYPKTSMVLDPKWDVVTPPVADEEPVSATDLPF